MRESTKPQLEKFIVGVVGATFGVNGFVKIHSTSGETEHLLKLQSAVLKKDENEMELKICEISKSPFVMRFEGIDNPEKAKKITGAKILTDRKFAAALKKDEFYIEDLKGLKVIKDNDDEIGIIIDIIEGGGGELAEIKLNSGEVKLVPFRKEFFDKINPKDGFVKLYNLWVLE